MRCPLGITVMFGTPLSPAYLLGIVMLALLQSVLPMRVRPWTLLISSLLFCASAGIAGFVLLLMMTGMTYVLARRAERRRGAGLFIVPVSLLLLPLIGAKLYGLFVPNPIATGALLPGMSFYLLQATQYLLDVRRGTLAERNPLKLLLSLSFFPAFLSGPIVRTTTFLPNVGTPYLPTERATEAAILRIAWGYFKKLVVADRLGVLLAHVWAQPEDIGTIDTVLTGMFSYLRVYADFSGYTDIAIGSAALLGVTLPENFRLPYTARSVRDFWRRWNITLSEWLKENVYIPIGGNRHGFVVECIAILATFLMSGAWHGTGGRFLVWGLLHGAWMIGERWFGESVKRAPIAGWTVTALFLSASFILFEADSLQTAATALSGIVRLDRYYVLPMTAFTFNGLTALAGGLLMIAGEWYASRRPSASGLTRWAILVFLMLLTLHFGMFGSRAFLYADF